MTMFFQSLTHSVRHVPLKAIRQLSTATGSSGSLVTLSKLDGVATLTLNNPEQLNKLDIKMGDEFEHHIRTMDCSDVGCVVLTGAGRAFSAGGDLKFLQDRHEDTPSRNAVIMRRFYERFLSLRDLPVPVIAAINGHAIGAGLCVALAADIRVVAADAKLGVTFAGLGLHPGMGSTTFLPRIVGPQHAAQLLLTGELIDGKRAVEIGMAVEHAHSGQAVVEKATRLAKRIAQGSPLAVRGCVRTLRMAQDEGLDRALWREADAQSQCYASRDLAEGVNAVASKRRPEFIQMEGYDEELPKVLESEFHDE